ncbi:MAG TPA: adenylyltransferase/cytidyltransferase family protein [archaeon]|nr:adenylyltransferase/cytidyltransferase family protein [archaeon]
MKTVLAFGTFDILHPGHISYLTQARGLGEKLVVVVATDLNVEKIKGKKPFCSEQERLQLVGALAVVDEVVLGQEQDMIKSVEKVNPNIVALGYDQNPPDEKLKEIFASRKINVKIVRLAPYKPEIYKSSKIKEKIRKTRFL